MEKNALIIMAKYPDTDSVKTRLMGQIPDDKRIQIYTKLLENTVNKLKSIDGVDSFITYSPDDAFSYFLKFGIKIFPQFEGDLGDRMFYAISWVLQGDYQKAVLVGVDIPDISASIVSKAFELLSDHDIVFGPARDGGYYLVGLKKPIRTLFHDIEWSTHYTLQQSMEKAAIYSYHVALTETLSDIDTIEDVKRAGLML